ncbi:hypothetical protein BT96DRAFT_1008154 [Gymnopus androsaceus JB14]|uniref:Uncharacterized protein n=1 Tax=Gymnopus androsaceus JB14 TaxID=1447944 RepID=A0A6A4GG41_9AGAR|nr:hypothetical protein BT96DRAFT_1008154 [Gymnopus androsaceus JB14]
MNRCQRWPSSSLLLLKKVHRFQEDLAVHVRKIENVPTWLQEALNGGPSGKLRKYRVPCFTRLTLSDILTLHIEAFGFDGISRHAKSATIRVLSKELNFEVLEWSSSTGSTFTDAQDASSSWIADDPNFTPNLNYSSSASQVVRTYSTLPAGSSSRTLLLNRALLTTAFILLEDLPNILHTNTRSQFHDAPKMVPIVIVLSDSVVLGVKTMDGAIDIRTLLPKDVLHGPYVHEIRFNPIAPTSDEKRSPSSLSLNTTLCKNLLLLFKCSTLSSNLQMVTSEARSWHLQFRLYSTHQETEGARSAGPYGKHYTEGAESSLISLDGKGSIQQTKLKDPPLLPPHLSEHDRRASRVDVNTIYADSPIDSSLFSLYIHQNFTQFCTDVDECDGIADWLSWPTRAVVKLQVFSSINLFHLLAIGTLRSLPTPVPRLNQKVYKPEFFDNLKKEKEAGRRAYGTSAWIVDRGWEWE